MSFTQAETDLIDILEKEFFDELDDYDCAEDYITQKIFQGLNDISEHFVKFINRILKKKNKKPLTKVKYDRKMKKCKEKVLKDLSNPKKALSDITQSSQNSSQISSMKSTKIEEKARIEVTSQVLDKPETIPTLKNILCVVEYREILIEELKPLVKKFVNTFTGIEIKTPYLNMTSYSLVEDVHIHDELGEFTYSHLQGCMKIYFKMPEGPLPQKFAIKKNYFSNNPEKIEFQNDYKEDLAEKNQESNMTLEKFLKIVVKANNKNPHYSKLWLSSLNEQHVEKFEEILAWEDKDWDSAKLEVNTKKLIQRQLNEFKYKTNLKLKGSLSKSEIYATTHRIRRFLIWKTNPKGLENIAYLDERALQAGFEEIKKEYTGDYLLQQLQVFDESYAIPKSYSKSLVLSRGMLLYGPPGTGKTTLIDTLPNKVGFTPISYPLCAAEVNRSLVGQTEKLLMELVTRATKIPYLLCCVGIDEIDGLAPKRDEKSSQHKVDALAVLLSVIGGIKDVSNLIFLASTNRLNQMDEAFKRRMSGQFFVGRPSPAARKSIIENAEGTGLDKRMIDQVVMMTANFSGAALKQFISYVVTEQRKLNKQLLEIDDYVIEPEVQETLSYEQLADIAARTSKQFSIKLGNYSLPELFILQKQKEKLLSLPFLKSLKDNKAIIIFKNNYVEIQYKRTRITSIPVSASDSELQEIDELDSQKTINASNSQCKDFFSLNDYITKIRRQEGEEKRRSQLNTNIRNMKSNMKLSKNNIEISYVNMFDAENLTSKKAIENAMYQQIAKLNSKAENHPERTFVVIWNDLFEVFQTSHMAKMKELDKIDVIRYLGKHFDRKDQPENLYNLYTTSESNYTNFLSATEWENLKPFNKQEIKFTGRILVDLNDEDQEIRFELDEEGDDRYQLHNEPLLLEKKATNSFQVLPKLVEFASERGIDFILLMDMDFLLSNNAFDESKIKESVTEKMQEFNCYEKSLLIIDVDSLVGVAQSVSHSSMGPSTSHSLSDSKLYNMIIHYAKSLPKILKNSEYWVALISKNEELTRMIKKDLSWPKTVKEIEKDEEEEKLQEEKRCVRCNEMYVEAKNELNNCCYHDGMIVEYSAPTYKWRKLTVKEAKMQFVRMSQIARNSNNHTKEPQFLYLCCWEPLKSQGCKKHKHISDEDQWEAEKNEVMDEYDEGYEAMNIQRAEDEKL